MAKILFLMCGPAGSGKSTWIQEYLARTNQNCIVVSRDEIRFEIVQEDEEYFSKEDEVFARFAREIDEALHNSNYEVVFADATHLTEKSRNKTLNAINLDCVDIIPVSIYPSLARVLEQNDRRSGRRHVPNHIVTNMWQRYEIPNHNEKYTYTTIIKEGEDV